MMKFFNNKEKCKKIVIAILIVMSFNFISPRISNASVDTVGGALFSPLAQLLTAIGDLLIEGLQKIFLGDSSIAGDAIRYIR